MTDFVSNLIWNSVEGFVEAGTRTAGGYAGDVLIKAGDMVERYGNGVGSSVEKAAAGYGAKISGQTPQKALPSSGAKRPGAKRANSIATSKPSQAKTPLGTMKYPGGKAITGAGTGGTSASKPAVGTPAKKTGVNTAVKRTGTTGDSTAKPLPKPYPQTSTSKPNTAVKKGTVKSGQKEQKQLPKPYPQTNTFSGQQKKTPVKPGQKAPTTVGGAASEGLKAYPGTEKKTPVKPKKYQPLAGYKPPAEKGEYQHISLGA